MFLSSFSSSRLRRDVDSAVSAALRSHAKDLEDITLPIAPPASGLRFLSMGSVWWTSAVTRDFCPAERCGSSVPSCGGFSTGATVGGGSLPGGGRSFGGGSFGGTSLICGLSSLDFFAIMSVSLSPDIFR